MGLAGAGFGAARTLEEIVAERFKAQMLQEEINARQQRGQIEQDRLAESKRQADMDAQHRADTLAAGERDRRDRSNARGMDLMRADKSDMDMDAAVSSLPPHLSGLGPLLKSGAVGKLSPDDLEDPAAKAKREADAREQSIHDQIRVRNATREPKAPDYQRVLVDGKETFLTPEEVRARGGVDAASRKRASTGMERQALSFYNRMNDALNTMDGVEDQLSERDILLINNSPLPDLINNRLLSGPGQQYAQALNTYTEARLRKESGAAIPASEFETDRRTIGRQANDKDDVRTQKRHTRRKTAEGVAYAAGPAYEEYYGEAFQRMPEAGSAMRKPIPGIEGGIAESTDGGKTWKRVQ